MDLTRRNLFRSAGAAAGVAALGSLSAEAVAGSAAARAAARLGRTTLDTVIAKGKPNGKGWAPLVRTDGELHRVRAGLGVPAQGGRKGRRTPILAFAQLSDVHILDAQSPARLEGGEGVSSSAYRPQEVLTAHIAEAMVRQLNQVVAGPATGQPIALALQTGDNSDNGQYNEIRWNIDVLDGGEVTPDSGDPARYEGVMDLEPGFYDVMFWHPQGTPEGEIKDDPRRLYGFPVIPDLLDVCRQTFQAQGLAVPWITAMGNHDELAQGNFPHSDLWKNRAIGDQKNTAKGIRTVTPDPDRRLLDRVEIVQEHFTTTGTPVGHGFTDENLSNATAYYTFDVGDVRFLVMDTVNANGGDDGSLDLDQFAWVHEQLMAATDKLVIAASHHPSWTMDNAQGPAGTRVLGEAVVSEFLQHENLIAWVNGHTHSNRIEPHVREGGVGGFWEINTASHIDWPQQSRIHELTDNEDGTLSIFTTMVDHGAPLKPGDQLSGPMKLAALGRLLAANDWQERDNNRRGKRTARNVELIVPAPAFLAG